ncbi:hypothetical protein [Alteraurantiacibacter palmitatis]|uniref:Uncharacterized protein n=1 Tax=Alteraurantiacibacter palmitatis TaxID=2054628 RepID=A0ABV7E4Z5_9SPHN
MNIDDGSHDAFPVLMRNLRAGVARAVAIWQNGPDIECDTGCVRNPYSGERTGASRVGHSHDRLDDGLPDFTKGKH